MSRKCKYTDVYTYYMVKYYGYKDDIRLSQMKSDEERWHANKFSIK